MTDYLTELEEKRNALNREADVYKKKRDRMNQGTRINADQRDQLNAKVKKLLKEANRYKEKRDQLNTKVREAKAEREILTREYNNLKTQLDTLKRSRINTSDEISLYKLKKEVKGLEFKQQISVLETDKERALINRISRIKKTILEKEKEIEGDEDFREILSKVKEAKREMDQSHGMVNELADLAQKEHDSMIECFSESDKIRKEADAAQERFVESKVMADEKHRKHIDAIHMVHDHDKIIFNLRQKKKGTDRKGTRAPASSTQMGKMEAERIYERFKRGEKISTEDLMLLQKYGFL